MPLCTNIKALFIQFDSMADIIAVYPGVAYRLPYSL